ncbi:MAG: aminotransferase class IV [Miltoncostaeaceae bacterium]
MGIALLETMRAGTGRVAWLDRHLDRMLASAVALEVHGMPAREDLAACVVRAIGRRAGDARLRLVAPTDTDEGCRVEMTAEPPLSAVPPALRARSVRGGWRPEARMWQHKLPGQTEQRVNLRARVARQGVERALLVDDRGNLGEGDLANAFAVVGGRLVTPPAHGLLPGITRAAVIAGLGAEVREVTEREWRDATEVFLTSAVSGVVSLVEIDGLPVYRGQVGPAAREAQRMLKAEWAGV